LVLSLAFIGDTDEPFDISNYIFVAEIRTLSQPKISVQDKISKYYMMEHMRTKFEKNSELNGEVFIADVIVLDKQPGVYELELTFNAQHCSWDYAWKSNRWSGPLEQHVVDVIALRLDRDQPSEYQVIASAESSPFVVLSSHKKPGRGAASTDSADESTSVPAEPCLCRPVALRAAAGARRRVQALASSSSSSSFAPSSSSDPMRRGVDPESGEQDTLTDGALALIQLADTDAAAGAAGGRKRKHGVGRDGRGQGSRGGGEDFLPAESQPDAGNGWRGGFPPSAWVAAQEEMDRELELEQQLDSQMSMGAAHAPGLALARGRLFGQQGYAGQERYEELPLPLFPALVQPLSQSQTLSLSLTQATIPQQWGSLSPGEVHRQIHHQAQLLASAQLQLYLNNLDALMPGLASGLIAAGDPEVIAATRRRAQEAERRRAAARQLKERREAEAEAEEEAEAEAEAGAEAEAEEEQQLAQPTPVGVGPLAVQRRTSPSMHRQPKPSTHLMQPPLPRTVPTTQRAPMPMPVQPSAHDAQLMFAPEPQAHEQAEMETGTEAWLDPESTMAAREARDAREVQGLAAIRRVYAGEMEPQGTAIEVLRERNSPSPGASPSVSISASACN